MFNISIKAVVGLLFTGLFLTACVWPESEDPFERLPTETIETIEGKLFPFSVSIATKITHRLEKDQKLQAYLASDVLRLEDFEGHEVEVDGFWKEVKMRQVFWVEALRVKDIEIADKDVEPEDSIFETKRFLFTFPSQWEYTTAPNGMVYFLDKSDPARRVFLTFEVSDVNKNDEKIEPNILIANMAGTKTISQDNLKRDREEITLLSNQYKKKYTFTFTNNFEDFEKKKSFFKLLNSFIEGDDIIIQYKRAQQQALAEKERLKLQAINKATEVIAKEEAAKRKAEELLAKKDQEPGFLDKFFTKEEEPTIETEAETQIEETPVVATKTKKSFTNLIDERAFSYSSSHYGLSFKIPYTYWYQNFGPEQGAITAIGFADHAFLGKGDINFWLRLKSGAADAESQVTENNITTIIYPRNGSSHFEFTGPVRYNDAMWSILRSME